MQADGELVTSEAGNRVRTAHDTFQPLRHLLEQFISSLVTQGIIDLLEVVEINEQQGHLQPVAAGLMQRLVQAVQQHRPVGQTGQAVIVGQLVKLLLTFEQRLVADLDL